MQLKFGVHKSEWRKWIFFKIEYDHAGDELKLSKLLKSLERFIKPEPEKRD